MPVPSIMMDLAETVVKSQGSVVLETNFIMTMGPMANTCHTVAGIDQLQGVGDQPFRVRTVVGADCTLLAARN